MAKKNIGRTVIEGGRNSRYKDTVKDVNKKTRQEGKKLAYKASFDLEGKLVSPSECLQKIPKNEYRKVRKFTPKETEFWNSLSDDVKREYYLPPYVV